jgi:hypothetical protein
MQIFFWISALATVLVACGSEDDPIDCEKSGPSISLGQVTNASNCSANDGNAVVSVSGGREPYTFFLNDQFIETSGQINNLSAGVYSILVTDANKCSAAVDNIAIMAEDFSFTTDVLPNTSCLSGNGSVSIDVADINPPYTYKIGSGDFATSNSFSGLSTGNHVVAVQDNNNCVITLSITVPRGFTGTSWANDIKPILEKSCAITGCHNGISRSNDFRTFSSAKAFAGTIRSNTQNKNMPPDEALTQSQIDLIACWVDDGAFNN